MGRRGRGPACGFGDGTADGYNFGGQHNVHIAVISECNWSINVLAMPS